MSDTEQNNNNGVETPSMTGTSVDGCATDARLTARCKWFNNKAGYGFVTVTGGEHNGTDVFVHHTGVSVSSEQYRYLVQGEYVHLDMVEMSEGAHKWQANDVRGINGGLLMCETRNEARESREEDEDEDDHGVPRHTSGRRGGDSGDGGGHGAKVQRYRVRGPGPREGGGRGGRGVRGVRGVRGGGGGGGNEVWELVRTTREGGGGHGHNRD